MPIVTTNSEHYQQIADTIRSYTGSEETFRPENMYGGVDGVYMAGYQAGQAEGGGGSYDEGFEAGKQAVNQRWIDLTRNKKYFHYFFACADPNYLKETPPIDTSSGTHFNYAYSENAALEVIGGVLDLTKAQYVTSMFYACSSLREVRFVPLSIKLSNGMGQSSNLSDASIQSIIDGLADLTGKTPQTFSFHSAVTARLTEEQITTIVAKNWLF